jgi:hypothetical protein
MVFDIYMRNLFLATLKCCSSKTVAANMVWSNDFMNNSLWDGLNFLMCNVLDEFNSNIMVSVIDTSIPTLLIILVLEIFKERHGVPEVIMKDYGTEFISIKLD